MRCVDQKRDDALEIDEIHSMKNVSSDKAEVLALSSFAAGGTGDSAVYAVYVDGASQ